MVNSLYGTTGYNVRVHKWNVTHVRRVMFLFKLYILNQTAYYYAHALYINNKYATEMKRTPFLIFSSLKNGEKENTLFLK